MVVFDYNPKKHKQIIAACAYALKQGKIVAYPTDTSYGLAFDVTNAEARRKFYRIKERSIRQPIHVIVPSLAYAKRLVRWNSVADKLAKRFWPGPLTLILPLGTSAQYAQIISGKTGGLGLRLPANKIALDLTKALGRPISATSANPSFHHSRGYDSYSARDVTRQFSKKKYKPDIIINAGSLPHRKPSTLLKITGQAIEILRPGPITKKQIQQAIKLR